MSQETQSQTETREQHYRQLNNTQRRTTWLTVFLPFILLVLVVVLIAGILMSLRTPTQVAVVSDFMFTLFIMCPLVICMFPIVVLMIVLVALVNRLYVGTKSPLRRLEQMTYTMEKRVAGWAAQVDNRVINWAVRFAPIRRILSMFDEPISGQPDGGETNESTTGS